MAHIQDKRKVGRGWVARYTDPAGRERSKAFAKKSEAEHWITDKEGAKLRQDWIDPDRAKTPFGEVAARHMATVAHVKPKTLRGYETLLAKHVLPRFGETPVGLIDTLAVREWIADLTTSDPTTSGLSASWTRQAYRLLAAIMQTAVEGGYVARTPCVRVKLPKLPDHDMLVIAPEDLERLAAAAGPDGLALLTLGYSGLRWGELVALRRERCHILASRLEVVENAVDLDGSVTFGSPKGNERRMVAIPRFLADALGARLADLPKDPRALVFSAPDGSPLRHWKFYRQVFKRAVGLAELPSALRIHDLRHTCASVLIRDGASIVQVQKQLGHKDASTTLRVYAHMWPDDLDRVADVLETARNRALAAAPVNVGRDTDGTAVVGLEQHRRSSRT